MLTKLYRSQKNTPNVVINIAGDFNLPDIDWDNQQTTNTRTASKHNKLLEIISEFGLQNMVNDPWNTHRIWQHSGSHTHLQPLHHHQHTHTPHLA